MQFPALPNGALEVLQPNSLTKQEGNENEENGKNSHSGHRGCFFDDWFGVCGNDRDDGS
jgi:hypothetical protein